jgi:hypothetical protein
LDFIIYTSAQDINDFNIILEVAFDVFENSIMLFISNFYNGDFDIFTTFDHKYVFMDLTFDFVFENVSLYNVINLCIRHFNVPFQLLDLRIVFEIFRQVMLSL